MSAPRTTHISFANNRLSISRIDSGVSNQSYADTKTPDEVWPLRNSLNLVETQEDYFFQLRALAQMFSNGGTVTTTVTNWLVATGNSINATQLKAANDFVVEIGSTILAKIIRFNPFMGTTTMAKQTALVGAGTDTLVGSPSFTSAGLPLNGTTQYLNTGVALTGLNTDKGGLGVYYSALTDATGTLIGCSDSVQGQFVVRYDTSANRIVGNFGGAITTNSALQTSVTAAPAKKYLHVERRGATDLELYSVGASVATNVTNLAVTNTSDVITVGANLADTVATEFATGTVGCYCLTDGTLSDANVLTLSNAIRNFMGKLGRG